MGSRSAAFSSARPISQVEAAKHELSTELAKETEDIDEADELLRLRGLLIGSEIPSTSLLRFSKSMASNTSENVPRPHCLKIYFQAVDWVGGVGVSVAYVGGWW